MLLTVLAENAQVGLVCGVGVVGCTVEVVLAGPTLLSLVGRAVSVAFGGGSSMLRLSPWAV